MPNYIKNRIELSGEKEQVDAFIKKFSTACNKEQHKSYDGSNTYQNEGGEYGWLNTETNVFKRRNTDNVIGVPAGFNPHMIEAWVRFPDFDKIVPMPESLHISSDSWVMPLENQFSTHTKFKAHVDELREYCKKQPEQKNQTIENFILGVRNYIEYGHATWYNWSVENWGTKWNTSECEKINDTTFDFITAWSGVPQLVEKMSIEFPSVRISYEYSDEDTGCNCGTGMYLNGEIDFRKIENSSKEAYEIAFKLRPSCKENYKLVDDTYEYIEED